VWLEVGKITLAFNYHKCMDMTYDLVNPFVFFFSFERVAPSFELLQFCCLLEHFSGGI